MMKIKTIGFKAFRVVCLCSPDSVSGISKFCCFLFHLLVSSSGLPAVRNKVVKTGANGGRAGKGAADGTARDGKAEAAKDGEAEDGKEADGVIAGAIATGIAIATRTMIATGIASATGIAIATRTRIATRIAIAAGIARIAIATGAPRVARRKMTRRIKRKRRRVGSAAALPAARPSPGSHRHKGFFFRCCCAMQLRAATRDVP